MTDLLLCTKMSVQIPDLKEIAPDETEQAGSVLSHHPRYELMIDYMPEDGRGDHSEDG
jgi:hypothetical protein